jgi:hypothetical protein
LSGAGKESWPKGNPPNPSPVAAWLAPPVQLSVPFSSINDHSSGAAAVGVVALSARAAAGVFGDPWFVLLTAAGRRMGMSILRWLLPVDGLLVTGDEAAEGHDGQRQLGNHLYVCMCVLG